MASAVSYNVNFTAIKVHRNYIAPLYTIPANIVRLRGGK